MQVSAVVVDDVDVVNVDVVVVLVDEVVAWELDRKRALKS